MFALYNTIKLVENYKHYNENVFKRVTLILNTAVNLRHNTTDNAFSIREYVAGHTSCIRFEVLNAHEQLNHDLSCILITRYYFFYISVRFELGYGFKSNYTLTNLSGKNMTSQDYLELVLADDNSYIDLINHTAYDSFLMLGYTHGWYNATFLHLS